MDDRLARWRAVLGFAVRYALSNLRGASRGQSLLSVVGVAIAVGLLLSVTSVSVGLAVGPTATTDDADYWVVPGESAGSVVTDVGGQRLGRVHDATARIEGMDGVTRATPVLATLAGVDVGDDREYVLVFGVIPGEDTRVAGLPTDSLTAGDPFYAGGDYDGSRTGEVVLSRSAGAVLDASDGDRVTLATGDDDANRTFGVTDVVAPRSLGVGELPVAVVHLSELQVVAGADSSDAADRILATATDPGVRDRLAGVYPDADVLSRDEVVREQATDSDVTVATAVVALVVAVTVGCLFIATTLGFDIAASARDRAVMAAVGVSSRTRATVTLVRGLVVCLLGGLGGVLLWAVVALGLNVGGARLGGTGAAVAFVHPGFVLYGLAVAVMIAVLTAPYLLFVSGRAAPTEVLAR